MLTGERQREIVRLLEEREVVHIGDLAQRFGVSEVTIRRDLKALHADKLFFGARTSEV